MVIESSILLNKHVSCKFMLKYYITVSFGQFATTIANKNLKIFMPIWFDYLKESKQILPQKRYFPWITQNARYHVRFKLQYVNI